MKIKELQIDKNNLNLFEKFIIENLKEFELSLMLEDNVIDYINYYKLKSLFENNIEFLNSYINLYIYHNKKLPTNKTNLIQFIFHYLLFKNGIIEEL